MDHHRPYARWPAEYLDLTPEGLEKASEIFNPVVIKK